MPSSAAFHYPTVARAIAFVRAQPYRAPSPEAVAEALGLDLAEWRQVLAEWAGVTPARFLHCLGRQYARERLSRRPELLPETHAGDRTRTQHIRQLTWEAMTPATMRATAQGIELGYGLSATPFGDALLAWTACGLCHLAFRSTDAAALLAELRDLWPAAALVRDDAGARSLTQRIFLPRSLATSATTVTTPAGPAAPDRGSVHLVLRGTPFQIRVWSALMRIPPGHLLSYRQFATLLGMPAAPRSVGSAIAANTLGYLVPCHRLIRANGDAGEFRWGRERKLALLAWEAA